MFKKIFAAFLVAGMVFAFSACDDSNEVVNQTGDQNQTQTSDDQSSETDPDAEIDYE